MEQSGKVKAALDYHAQGKPGKIEVHSSKSTKTQQDLSLTYSPGVAEPCKAIAENGQEVYRYTTKGNMVAVISNGTTVLGLGNIGPEASKPVMEGKAVLFKVFADVDVFDLELNSQDVNAFVNSVKSLEPTFGGINLEDLKAPACFEIEKRLEGCSVVDPEREPERQKQYGEFLFDHRKRKGLTKKEAVSLMQKSIYFGTMMVQQGAADVLISGSTRKYVDSLRPALHTVGKQPGVQHVTAMYILMTQKGPYFVADPTVNVDPGVAELVDIAEQTHQTVQQFNIKPKIAMLSYTNFGSAQGEIPKKVSEATRKLKERNPGMIIDGDIQGNFAVNNSLRQEFFDFSDLSDQTVNTLIFPNLASSNIAYKLLQALGAIDAIGPLIVGLNKSINVLQMGSSVDEIVNMTAYGVMDAQQK